MAKKQGVVTKIYELRTVGYETVHEQFVKLSGDLAKLKKQIIDLQGQKLGLSGKDLEKVNQQIIENGALQENLKTKLKGVNSEGDKSVSMYYRLNQAYIAAKKSAQDLAAAHGVESKQAVEAAATAAAYKQQIVEINNLVKAGGKVAPVVPLASVTPQEVPFTSNLADLEKERESLKKTGEAVDELNVQEAQAANTAAAMGEANVKAAVSAEEGAVATAGLSTKYQQYTGSLQDNLRVQIENNNVLATNRAQQKELEASVIATGQATDAQIAKLTALREEEVLLIETNKSLSVTVRNQAKELISANGSLDESQAQLNQLQQSYESLSDVEKASPFGREMKNEIDQLEPKVKSLEAELGKFSRNVGNYPQIFGGAFKVLNTELDAVEAKIVSGNFGGKELDQLTAKQQVLKSVTATLGTEFSSTAQKAAAYKEAGRLLGSTFGTNSDVFKNFSAQVAQSNLQLKESDKQLTKAASSGDKAVRSFSGIYGNLRKLANLIPGIGISGLLLLIPNLATAAYEALFKVSSGAKKAAKDIKEAFTGAHEEIGKEVGEVRALYEITQDLTLSITQRKIATNRLLEVNKENNKETGDHNKLLVDQNGILVKNDDAINTLTNSLEKQIKTKVFLALIEKAYGQLLDAQSKSLNAQTSVLQDVAIKGLNFIGGLFGVGTPGVKDVQKNIKKSSEDNALLYYNTLKTTLVEKLKSGELDLGGVFDTKTVKDTAAKDAFALIEAERLRLLAIENRSANDIAKVRKLTFDEEKAHLKRIEEINVDALQKKIQVLANDKKLDAQQKAQKAKFFEEISSIQLDTSQKLNAIDKKVFDEKVAELNRELEDELSVIKENNRIVQDNLAATELEKAQAQLKAGEDTFTAKQKFLDHLLELDAQFNKEAVHNAELAVNELEAIIRKDRDKLSLATLTAIEDAGNREVVATEIKFAKIRNTILSNEKLSAEKRKELLDKLERAEKRTVLSKQIEKLKAELFVMQYLLGIGLVTEADFLKKQKELFEKQGSLLDAALGDEEVAKKKANEKFANFKSFLQDGLRKLLKIDKGSAEDDMMGRIIAESFDLAQQAMNGFFDAEEDRIKRNLDLQLERIDMEKQQVIARAQSQAEIDSLEKQFEAKKKKAQHDAGEQLKKNRRTEAKLSLAAELANIAVQASEYPFPASLIIGGILTALAVGRYALRVSEINRQQFEKGGVPTKTGGVIKGPSHAAGGVPFEAEGGELAILTKRTAKDKRVRTLTGTPLQIASHLNEMGGGISFAKRASTLFGEGGLVGSQLQAPIFVPSNSISVSSGGNADLVRAIDGYSQLIKQHIDATDKRIDRIKTYVVEREITSTQKEQARKTAVGTLG
jgi:hypothetical protein